MIFLDTAKPDEVRKWAHLISGVTCNPLILSRERPNSDPLTVLHELVDASDKVNGPGDVSFQVWSDDPDEMLEQANQIVQSGSIVKLPMNETGIKIADDFEYTPDTPRPVNFTGIMGAAQLIVACHMAAAYASLFWGRAESSQIDPEHVLEQTDRVTRNCYTRVLVGSIQGPGDVVDAFAAGAHVVTVQPAILQKLVHHDRTESTIREFLDAWRSAK